MSYIGATPTIGAYHKLDSITCDGSTAYTMQLDSANFVPESVNHLIVSVNGVIQAPTDSFTVSSSTITFASALSSSDTIDFIMASRHGYKGIFSLDRRPAGNADKPSSHLCMNPISPNGHQ